MAIMTAIRFTIPFALLRLQLLFRRKDKQNLCQTTDSFSVMAGGSFRHGRLRPAIP
jgi:hypothetical protein